MVMTITDIGWTRCDLPQPVHALAQLLLRGEVKLPWSVFASADVEREELEDIVQFVVLGRTKRQGIL